MIKIKVDFGKKIILAVAIVLACSMFLTGCSNKVSFKFRGGHVDIQEYPEYLQSEVLVNSLEDLNAFRNSLTVRYNKKTVEYTPFEDEIFIY